MAKELELNSFLIKFTQLCNAGLEAKLQLNCKNGHASVSLEVMLGPLQSTSNVSLGGVSSSFKQKRNRSSSYYRRQESRRNASKQSTFNGHSMTAAEEVVVVENDIGIVKDEADDNEVSGESIGQAEGSLGIDVEDDTVELRQLK